MTFITQKGQKMTLNNINNNLNNIKTDKEFKNNKSIKSNKSIKIDKQDLFIKYFLDPNSDSFLNSYQSALKAGYKKSVAENITSELKKNKYRKISGKIKEFKEKLKESVNITPEFVLNKLLEVLELFKNPEEMKKHYARTSDIVKVLELLGKYLAMFTEKIKVEDEPVLIVRDTKKESKNEK